MMFVHLDLSDGRRHIAIRPDHIVALEGMPRGTKIHMNNGDYFTVEQTVYDIEARMQPAQKAAHSTGPK